MVGSRLRLTHAEKTGRVESLYDCDRYEDGDGQMMTSLGGRCCEDETRSMNEYDCDKAVKGYVLSTLF